jgi:hypothetical protein
VSCQYEEWCNGRRTRHCSGRGTHGGSLLSGQVIALGWCGPAAELSRPPLAALGENAALSGSCLVPPRSASGRTRPSNGCPAGTAQRRIGRHDMTGHLGNGRLPARAGGQRLEPSWARRPGPGARAHGPTAGLRRHGGGTPGRGFRLGQEGVTSALPARAGRWPCRRLQTAWRLFPVAVPPMSGVREAHGGHAAQPVTQADGGTAVRLSSVIPSAVGGRSAPPLSSAFGRHV